MFVCPDRYIRCELLFLHRALLSPFNLEMEKQSSLQAEPLLSKMNLYYHWRDQLLSIIEAKKPAILSALKKPGTDDDEGKWRYFCENILVNTWCSIIQYEAQLDALSMLPESLFVREERLRVAEMLSTELAAIQSHHNNYNFVFSFQLTEPQAQPRIITEVDSALTIAATKLEADKRTALRLMRPSSHIYRNISTHSLELSRLYAIKASQEGLPQEEKRKLLEQTIRFRKEAPKTDVAADAERLAEVSEKINPVSNLLATFTHLWKKDNSPAEQFRTALNPNKSWVNPYRLAKLFWHLHQKPAALTEEDSFKYQLKLMFEEIYSTSKSPTELTDLYAQLHSGPIRNLVGCLEATANHRDTSISQRNKAKLFQSLIVNASNYLHEFIKEKEAQKTALVDEHIKPLEIERQKHLDTFDMLKKKILKKTKAGEMKPADSSLLTKSNTHYVETAEAIKRTIDALKQKIKISPITSLIGDNPFDFSSELTKANADGVFLRTRHTLEFIHSLPAEPLTPVASQRSLFKY